MTTKRCNRCQLVKSVSEFCRHKKNHDGFNITCRACTSIYQKQLIERGQRILKNLAATRGCCQHCSRPYTDEDWHLFEFDHIDANLKQTRRETDGRWVLSNVDEFNKRVAPNLQLLCVKCHKIKSIEEQRLGGSVYQKMFGQQKPAQVIQRDLTLFDHHLTLEPGEEYTFHDREGEWWTVRDMFGNLIRYEHRSKFIK